MKSKIYGLILSAGFSSRMDEFKPLASYKNKTFIEHIINKLSTVCDDILIVTGYNNKILEESMRAVYKSDDVLKKIDFVFNPNFRNGMFSSIKTGVKSLLHKMSESDYVMLHLVDQPHISNEVYKKLADKTNQKVQELVIPSYGRKAGHPLIIPRSVLQAIITAPDTENLRSILKKWHDSTTYVEIDEESVLQDVNTLEEQKEFLT